MSIKKEAGWSWKRCLSGCSDRGALLACDERVVAVGPVGERLALAGVWRLENSTLELRPITERFGARRMGGRAALVVDAHGHAVSLGCEGRGQTGIKGAQRSDYHRPLALRELFRIAARRTAGRHGRHLRQGPKHQISPRRSWSSVWRGEGAQFLCEPLASVGLEFQGATRRLLRAEGGGSSGLIRSRHESTRSSRTSRKRESPRASTRLLGAATTSWPIAHTSASDIASVRLMESSASVRAGRNARKLMLFVPAVYCLLFITKRDRRSVSVTGAGELADGSMIETREEKPKSWRHFASKPHPAMHRLLSEQSGIPHKRRVPNGQAQNLAPASIPVQPDLVLALDDHFGRGISRGRAERSSIVRLNASGWVRMPWVSWATGSASDTRR